MKQIKMSEEEKEKLENRILNICFKMYIPIFILWLICCVIKIILIVLF